MSLAWACGEPHADFVLASLTPEQFADIEAFADVVPLPEQRADLRGALQCLTTARSAGNRVANLDTFLLKFGPDVETPDQDQDEMNRQMAKVAAQFNRTTGRKAG